MDWEEFLEIMEMDSSDIEISYFEDLAHIFEYAEEIPLMHIEKLISMSDASQMEQLIKEYFDDIMKNLDDADLYTLMTEILNVMSTGIVMDVDETSEKLAQEIVKFREWYHDDKVVYNSDENISLCEALCRIKIDKLTGKKGKYDFDNALDYEIDRYTLTLSPDDMDDYE